MSELPSQTFRLQSTNTKNNTTHAKGIKSVGLSKTEKAQGKEKEKKRRLEIERVKVGLYLQYMIAFSIRMQTLILISVIHPNALAQNNDQHKIQQPNQPRATHAVPVRQTTRKTRSENQNYNREKNITSPARRTTNLTYKKH